MRANVLIVEDELLIAFHLQDLVERAGFHVTALARSAEEAIRSVREQPVAFAFMDMRLDNGSSGLYAAKVLFESHGVRCVFVSANLDEQTRTASQDLRPLGYVGKPFLPSDILAALEYAARETASSAG